jgi:hypothetical protein
LVAFFIISDFTTPMRGYTYSPPLELTAAAATSKPPPLDDDEDNINDSSSTNGKEDGATISMNTRLALQKSRISDAALLEEEETTKNNNNRTTAIPVAKTTNDLQPATSPAPLHVVRVPPLGSPPSSTLTTTTREQDLTSCFLQTSCEWLEKPRFGNINMTQEEWTLQRDMMMSSSSSPLLHHIDTLLGQTLVWPTSRLVQSTEEEQDDPTADYGWLTRLSFAIIHHHQHCPARNEWKSTTTNECSMEHRWPMGF